jgi:hypothetical protein
MATDQPVAEGRQITPQDIERRFTYVKPTGEARRLHNDIRAVVKDVAHVFNDSLPDGREKALVFTALEEASFWAHAAIARDPSMHEVSGDGAE